MIDVSYETSLLPHKCDHCGKWIKPRAKFVQLYLFSFALPDFDITLRFCDPHCARSYHNNQMEEKAEEKELRRIVLGDEK